MVCGQVDQIVALRSEGQLQILKDKIAAKNLEGER